MTIKKIIPLAIVIIILSIMIFFASNNNGSEKENNSFVKNSDKTILTPSVINKDIAYVATRSKIDKFYFAGDINFSKNVKKAYDREGYLGIIDPTYLEILKDGDVCVANLECPISDNVDDKADKEYTFCLPTKYANALKEIGFNVYGIANNHILDFGEKALMDTLDELDKRGLKHIGAGKNVVDAMKPYTIDIQGKKYAIFAATTVIPDEAWKATEDKAGVNNGFDLYQFDQEILKYKKDGYKVFVYMHWGKELEEFANEKQKQTARGILYTGADLVIGSHSHTLQEIEMYDNQTVVYSMGNFIFGGNVHDTFLLEVSVDYSKNEDGDISLKIYPGNSNYEKVISATSLYVNTNFIANFNNKCKNCVIDADGKIYSLNDEYIKNKLAEISK